MTETVIRLFLENFTLTLLGRKAEAKVASNRQRREGGKRAITEQVRNAKREQ